MLFDLRSIANNAINGTIPPTINLLSKLTTLDINTNAFSGGLINMANMQALVYFDASNNMLTRYLPVMFGTMPRLQTLLLNNNQLTGAIPGSNDPNEFLHFL